MTQFSDERGGELRELFFETAQELLQSLNEEALKLEKHPGDAETVRSIRRIVHTLKGDAAACGYRELSESAHELEDALACRASHRILREGMNDRRGGDDAARYSIEGQRRVGRPVRRARGREPPAIPRGHGAAG